MSHPQPSASPMGGIQLDDLFEIVERRRWWLVLGALAGLLLGVAAYFVLPARYSATTTILVEPQRVPESYVQSTVTLQIEQRLNTLRERVTSYANLSELIDMVGQERLDPTGRQNREALMARIRNGLVVTIGGSGHSSVPVFEIKYSGEDPAVVADVVREMASLFISENLKDRAAQATATAEFLDRELSRLRQEVSAQEERIRTFRAERMGALPSQLDANLRALDRLNLELASNLEAQEAAGQRITLLRHQLEEARSEAGPGSSGPTLLSAALRATREQLLQAERIYTDEHPNVKRLRAEVAELEQQLAQTPQQDPDDPLANAPTTVTSPTVASLEREIDQAGMDLEARRRQEARVRDSITKIQERVDETPRREQELHELTRDYDNLTETYRQLLSKKYEAALARNLEQAQQGERFKLLQPARVPSKPSWPDPLIVIPAGLGVGLVLVLLWIAYGEFRNPAFRSVNRLARSLGVPVFASIPRIDNDQIYEQVPSEEVDPKLVVHTAPESAPAEQYRGFLPFFLDAENCRVLLVTSAARGDGKTLTCMNLALTLASDLNLRVLVVDGDLRRPKVHRMVKSPRRRGLSSILMNEAKLADCALNSKIPRVSILPAGPSVKNPLKLLTAPEFITLIEEAKTFYDVVLIDSPPLLPVVDSKILRKMADMVLFVVRADATPREAVTRSLREMVDVAGVVFNEVSPGSFRRYYYYDAYSRYAYGDPTQSIEAEERDDA